MAVLSVTFTLVAQSFMQLSDNRGATANLSQARPNILPQIFSTVLIPKSRNGSGLWGLASRGAPDVGCIYPEL